MSKKKQLTLSIIIPAYNEEHHLGRCLQAIARQTIQPDEVIVVNNNSTDRTVKIANQYSFVKLLNERRQGIVYARNRGFDAARGEIIARLDADTVLPPDWLEKVREFYQKPDHLTQAITGGCAFYNVRLPRLDTWITSQFVFRLNRLLVGHYVLWGANMAMPRQLWHLVRKQVCRRTDIHEDLDLAIHLHRIGYQITYHATLTVGARMSRVFDNHKALWANLMLWPNTLRIHNMKTWPLGWLGAVFLYACQFVPRLVERFARLFGRPPLPQ